MTYELPTICPVCRERFNVKQLSCATCGSVLEGNFELNRLSRLSGEMQNFVITFLKCRGNIREMEKALDISYPTVRARIDEIIAALGAPDAAKIREEPCGYDGCGGGDGYGGYSGYGGYGGQLADEPSTGMAGDTTNRDSDAKPARLEILTRLANGEIDVEDARKMLGGKL